MSNNHTQKCSLQNRAQAKLQHCRPCSLKILGTSPVSFILSYLNTRRLSYEQYSHDRRKSIYVILKTTEMWNFILNTIKIKLNLGLRWMQIMCSSFEMFEYQFNIYCQFVMRFAILLLFFIHHQSVFSMNKNGEFLKIFF